MMIITPPLNQSSPISVRLYRHLVHWLSLPLILMPFLSSSVGHEYGVGALEKIFLLWRFIRNTRRIPTASSWYEHLLIAETILKFPKTTIGAIVECGAYKGGSSANISLVCGLVGRKLLIFDSFAGLPQPQKSDTKHHCPAMGEIHTYSKGAFKGKLAEVKSNIKKYGHLSTCQFFPGYFTTSLRQFTRQPQPIAGVFVDVDLVESLKTCLRYLWPRLARGGFWFTHEAHHLEIAAVFFDQPWWRHHLHQRAPGLIGAGIGIPMGLVSTALGFSQKSLSPYRTIPQKPLA